MAEPTEKTATVAAEPIADDNDLGKAWEAVNGDEVVVVEPKAKEEPPKEETKKDEKAQVEPASDKSADGTKTVQPDELTPEEKERIAQQERSRLGRQNKGLKDRLKQLEAAATQRTETEGLPEVVTTPQDVEKVIEARNEKQKKAQEAYEADYIKQLDAIEKSYSGDKDKIELHEEIVDHMIKNFNRKYSDSGFGDARVNYAEAKASLIETKAFPQAKLPKRNTAEEPPIRPAATSTRTDTKVVTLPPMDDATKDYVEYLRRNKYTDEQIAKELST